MTRLLLLGLTRVLNPHSQFRRVLEEALEARGLDLADICPADDAIAQRVLCDYGAIQVAGPEILPPPLCVFTSEDEVTAFQKAAGWATARIEDYVIELQPAAMKALLRARSVALSEGLNISSRDGAEGTRRTYDDTVRLWNSRFLPALNHWQSLGRLSSAQTAHLRSLPIIKQVGEVLELEKDGIFFSKDFSKSVLYSIAAPGTSQHIAMLAFDANEFLDPRIRRILADHGWFQTVLSDLPHFTYLGLKESDLPARGLKCVEVHGQNFWIPDVD